MSEIILWYTNVFVSDFGRSVQFYRDQLGLKLIVHDEKFGYASFETGSATLAINKVDMDTQAEMVGRHTGVGLGVRDLQETYERLAASGVEFDMPPTNQPWGGTMAMFKDPDGNHFYLDQIREEH